MTEVIGAALTGIYRASESFERAARNIARVSYETQAFLNSTSSDRLELSREVLEKSSSVSTYKLNYPAEFTALLEAKTAFEANLKVLSMQQDLDQSILDMFA